MKRMLLVLLALASLGTAHAQGRRMVIEEIDVVGKVRKPEILIFVSRQNLSTDYQLELKESFVPKVIQSVEQKPF
jgi:hypothetical protein